MQVETAKYHHIWDQWSKHIHRWGMGSFLAWFLEAVGPLHFIGAQLVYIGQPIAEAFLSGEQVSALADLLEEPRKTNMFIRMLRESEEA